MANALIVVHGGNWKENIYDGGIKDYIPMPSSGITFSDLLSKLEVRLKKDKAMYTFDIDAMVNSGCGEIMRMKVTDEFEWSSLLEIKEMPTLYVNSYPIMKACIQTKTYPTNEDDAVRSLTVPPLITASTSCTSPTNCVASQWMIAGVTQHSSTEHDEIPIAMEPIDGGQLVRGSLFSSKDSLISAIHAYHLQNRLEFRTPRSSPQKIRLVCKHAPFCMFSLRAKSLGNAWTIYKWVTHTCEKDIRTGDEPNVSSRAIAEYIGPRMTEDGFLVRACDIQGQFLREFGLRVKYPAALAGKNRALKSIYGDQDKSFQMLAKYLYMLQFMNPGSVVDLQTLDDCRFQYCFFSLAASIRAFRACRPVVVIDATHLKGKYRGVLFVATTKDANEQIVPLAFGVGDKENDSSWTWFLDHVRQCFGTPDNLLIVSDQHKSIKNSVEYVYPGTPHGFCTYHIQGNLRTWGDPVIDLFHAAANAYKEEDFIEHMNNIQKSAPAAYERLMAIDPMAWASCKCPVRRYRFGTSNAVESLNGRLRWARKLPVTSLLEYARNMMQSWFYKRRTKAQARDSEVSEYAEKRLGFAIEKGISYRVQPITDFKFNIISGMNSNIVDLSKWECTCKVFQTDLFPCSHATAAIRFKKQTPIAYVHSYYSTAMWREIYASEVMPVPDPTDWRIPAHIELIVVGTPKNPRQAGRPKEKRIPKEGVPTRVGTTKEGESEETATKEMSKKGKRSCSRCHNKGHYANTCEVFLQVIPEEVTTNSQGVAKRRRKTKKCSICGVEGHTRTTCKGQ